MDFRSAEGLAKKGLRFRVVGKSPRDPGTQTVGFEVSKTIQRMDIATESLVGYLGPRGRGLNN